MECPVCFDGYSLSQPGRLPKVLPCGHSACVGCLGRVQSCPKCHKAFDVPADSLLTNFDLIADQESAMDALPDDVLLAVLRLLPLREVVGARRVCRRWRDLALHPDLWRHRSFHANDLSGEMLFTALHLAPCVFVLDFANGLEKFGEAAVSTACAAAELSITVQCPADVVLTTMAIRNQASLGRLKVLEVIFTKPEAAHGCGVADLFTEIHRVRGLEELWVNLSSCEDSQPLPMSGAVVPAQLLPPSLTECNLMLGSHASQLRPYWEFQLASHAATLRKVDLSGTDWTPSLYASLFDNMPALEELECPVLEDMHLLKCGRLRKLSVYPDFLAGVHDHSFKRTLANVMVFFHGATELVELDLSMWHDDDRAWVEDFVAALASSGRSKLEVLYLSQAQLEEPGPLHLEGLRSLKRLKLGNIDDITEEDIPDSLLKFLGKVSLPSLCILRGYVGRFCFHNYLEQSTSILKAVMRKNPQLHILTFAMCCSTFLGEDEPLCGACDAGGCEETGFAEGFCVGLCAHPASGDAGCSIREHTDGDYEQWLRFPRDAV